MTSAIEISVDADTFTVTLSDGRLLTVPLSWFPVLLNATAAQLRVVRISSSGLGLHWPELDEDISVPALLRGQGDQTSRNKG
ncbi:DUF2442 domain-containing protein [Paraburkholderia aromaticivorans]|uniref:DUF2442 domain-containing protein n=1 Tax=Paraburkholderia aromaticivorans TaxID=2026199 RepID=UPI0014560B91|nr:DUF2442 domain-containing protein [Paraburkholderia aromaticivorans]